MRQTNDLLLALRQELKAANVNYAVLANHLGLSENSIKRLFSQKKVTLERLEQILDYLGIELIDLVRRAEQNADRIEQLSEEQEKLIVSDSKLLLVAISVLHKWSFEQLLETYKISETECIRLLVTLDKFRIIELLPLNRFKLLVSKDFAWRKNGPVERYFRTHIQQDFFNAMFNKPGELLMFRSGMLSRNSNAVIQKKVRELIKDFNLLHEQDSSLPLEERFGSSIVMAFRPWEYKAFNLLRRKPNEKVF